MAQDAMGIAFKDDITSGLKNFAKDIKAKALRPAAFAGITVLYEEMQIRVPVDEGTLKDSLYRYFDEKQSKDGQIVFVAGPNKVKAPHWHLVEYGTANMPAIPYIRPSYDAKIKLALDVAKNVLAQKIKDLV